MKAQTSTEYLIILAIVMIIALIAQSSLGSVLGIGMNSQIKQSMDYWKTSQIALMGYVFINDNGNDAKLIIRNNYPTVIILDEINISKNEYSETTTNIINDTTVLSPGGQVTKTLDLDSNNPCYNKEPGNEYNFKIRFKIDDEETGSTYYFTGMPVRGRCAQSLS